MWNILVRKIGFSWIYTQITTELLLRENRDKKLRAILKNLLSLGFLTELILLGANKVLLFLLLQIRN